MNLSHEIIKDDDLTQLYFSRVEASNDLLLPHWHHHLEMIYVKTGGIEANINDISYEIFPGDILLVNPKDIHYTHVHGECCYYLLQISSFHLKRIDPDWKLIHFAEYFPRTSEDDTSNSALAAVFEEFIRLSDKNEKGYQMLFLSRLYQLLHLLYTKESFFISVRKKSRTERDFLRIEKCMQFVKRNYRQQISLAEAAAQLSVTPEYFCRLFKKYTGQTFLNYVSQIRLLHFYQDLLRTDESITFLLSRNGITNYKQFMRMFKEAYGTTPHKLRAGKKALQAQGADNESGCRPQIISSGRFQ